MNPHAALLAMIAMLAALTGRATSLFAEDVEVRLTDGRTLRGCVVENQLNAEQVVLELRFSGITIRRTLNWKQIVEVKVTPQRKLAAARKSAPSEQIVIAVPQEIADPLPLAQLLVKADPISTFGKMDWDSLRITLRGVDRYGDGVPLFGTTTVTLWGQERVSPESKIVRHPFVTDANYGSRYLSASSSSYAYQHPFVTASNPTVELQSWTQTLSVETHGGELDSAVDERVRLANTWGSTGNWQDVRVGSRQDGRRAEFRGVQGFDSVLVLPLSRPLPDQDNLIGTFGEVTVKLSMPGVGVFEANAPDIVLSHQSALRRERLDRDGSRFFPDDSTTGSPQTSRSRNRFTWPGGVSGPDRGILPIQP